MWIFLAPNLKTFVCFCRKLVLPQVEKNYFNWTGYLQVKQVCWTVEMHQLIFFKQTN